MNNYQIINLDDSLYYVMNNGVDEKIFQTLQEAEEYVRQQEDK